MITNLPPLRIEVGPATIRPSPLTAERAAAAGHRHLKTYTAKGKAAPTLKQLEEAHTLRDDLAALLHGYRHWAAIARAAHDAITGKSVAASAPLITAAQVAAANLAAMQAVDPQAEEPREFAQASASLGQLAAMLEDGADLLADRLDAMARPLQLLATRALAASVPEPGERPSPDGTETRTYPESRRTKSTDILGRFDLLPHDLLTDAHPDEAPAMARAVVDEVKTRESKRRADRKDADRRELASQLAEVWT